MATKKVSMTSYKVRLARPDGKVIEENIEAESTEEVVAIARGRNLIPVEINQVNLLDKDLDDLDFGFMAKVKTSDLAIFSRQLAAMLGAGMPINRALDIQATQTDNPTLKNTIEQVSIKIKQGEPLSESMAQYPEVFPLMLINMIEAGESTGNLDETLERMATHFTSENKTNNQVKKAMTYPIILVIVMVVILIIMMVFVLPQFESMFSDADSELPAITRIVMSISRSFMSYWFIYVAIVAGAFFGFQSFKKTPKGKYMIDEAKLKLPIIGGPMRQIVTARFTRTLATLLSSGVSIIDGIIMAADTTGNVLIIDAISIASDGIKRGMSLTSELRKIEYFPLMMVSMVGIGEETGEIDELLITTADYYDEELASAIDRLLGLIEPVMVIIIGIIVGAVVMAVMLPMFELQSGGLM